MSGEEWRRISKGSARCVVKCTEKQAKRAMYKVHGGNASVKKLDECLNCDEVQGLMHTIENKDSFIGYFSGRDLAGQYYNNVFESKEGLLIDGED